MSILWRNVWFTAFEVKRLADHCTLFRYSLLLLRYWIIFFSLSLNTHAHKHPPTTHPHTLISCTDIQIKLKMAALFITLSLVTKCGHRCMVTKRVARDDSLELQRIMLVLPIQVSYDYKFFHRFSFFGTLLAVTLAYSSELVRARVWLTCSQFSLKESEARKAGAQGEPKGRKSKGRAVFAMLFAVYVQGQRNLERLSALFLLNDINRGACFLSYIVISCCSFMTGIGPIDETACWPVPSPLSRLIRE